MTSMHAALSNALARLFEWTSFSDADEARERTEVTPSEKVEGDADVYGLAASMAACRIEAEDEDCLLEALYMLDAELARIPDKAALLEAQEKCPDLVDDNFKSAFLWRENLDAKVAAQRIVRYWEYRRRLFGPEKCFMPLALRGALKDDLTALSQGMIRVLPTKDNSGRAMILWNPSLHDRTKYSRESMLRACWYTFHALVDDDPTIQKAGVVLLVFPKHARLDHFDIKQYQPIMELEDKYLPVRFRSIHVCHPDLFFHIISPAIKGALNRRTRQRLKIHYGSDENVLERLAVYGMPQDRLPSCLGGGVMLDHENWLAQRCITEASENNAPSPVIGSSSASSTITGGIVSLDTVLKNAQKTEGGGGMQEGQKKSTNPPPVVGRKGDPRMNRAFQVKIAKPHLSLLDALLEGGFVFPELGAPFSTDNTLLDTDNVLLVQRKNQLMRRLRKARAKEKGKA